MQTSKSVDDFIAGHPRWREILTDLREILRSTGMEETVKWGVPVYTLGGKNVVGLTAFKQHAALWFFQGALLKDEANVLVNAQEGKTRAQRQWRFESAADVDPLLVAAYVQKAMKYQEQGKLVSPAPKKKLVVPGELADALDAAPSLRKRFDALAPFRQREYADYVSGAKQAATRARRLEKILPMIEAGKGLNDRYR